MNNKIAIILTSIERPQLLKKCLVSIVENWQENFILMIGNQNGYESETYRIIHEIMMQHPNKEIRYYELKYDCGISQARNELIYKACLWNIPYVLLTADSITFNNSIKEINYLVSIMKLGYYDLVGLNLYNRIPWEAKLNLIPNKHFELDFIDPRIKQNSKIVECDIVRNLWIAKTESLIEIPYDENLIMVEHEDFFWRFKLAGFKVGCTNICNGTYNKENNNPKYNTIRSTNFRIGMQRLLKKYSLKSWVKYEHIERTLL